MAIMIPLQLKFGSEKRQLAILVIVGAVTLLGILIKKTGESLGFPFQDIIKSFSVLSPAILIGCGILLVLLAVGISLKISIRVMERKEF